MYAHGPDTSPIHRSLINKFLERVKLSIQTLSRESSCEANELNVFRFDIDCSTTYPKKILGSMNDRRKY